MSENPENNGQTASLPGNVKVSPGDDVLRAVVAAGHGSLPRPQATSSAVERTFHRASVDQAPHRTLNRFAPTKILPPEMRSIPEASTQVPDNNLDVQRVCSYPVPGDRIWEHYSRVIELLDRRDPAMAASMRDGLERIERAKQDLLDLQEQLQIEHQRANEDAAKCSRELEAKIEAVQREIDEAHAGHLVTKREIFERRREFAREYMAGQALAGIFPNPAEAFGPMSRGDRPLITDVDENETSDTPIDEATASFPDDEAALAPRVVNQSQAVATTSSQTPVPSAPLVPQSPSASAPAPVLTTAGQWSVAPYQAAESKATVVRLPPGVELEPQDSTAIPLPVEEARQRARSLQAIAADEGFLPDGAAVRTLGKYADPGRWHSIGAIWYAFISGLSTLVCGAIFAFSLGIITGFIDPDILAMRPGKELGPFIVMCLVGTVLFYLMGRAITALVAHAAELNQNTITAGISKDSIAVARRIRWSAVWVLIVGILGITALAVIEANVERHGIAHYFRMQQMSSLIAQGKNISSGGISSETLWAIALMAGIPFILYHASHAWVESRQEVVISHLNNLREKEVYQLAQQLQQQRIAVADEKAALVRQAWHEAVQRDEAELEAATEREEQARREQIAAWKEVLIARAGEPVAANREEETASSDAGMPVSSDGDTQDDYDNSSDSFGTAPGTPPEQYWQQADNTVHSMGTVWESTKPELQEKIARHLADLISVKSELGIVHAELRFKLGPLRDRLQELKSQRVSETPAIGEDARRRLDDARRDYEYAVLRFDRYYTEHQEKIMTHLRGGLKSRIIRWWSQKPLGLD